MSAPHLQVEADTHNYSHMAEYLDIALALGTHVSVNQSLVNDIKDFKDPYRSEFKYLVMKIKGDGQKEVVLDHGVGKDVLLPDFFEAEFKDGEPAYIAINFEYKTRDGRPEDEVILIEWNPIDATKKQQTLYTSTTPKVKSALVGDYRANLFIPVTDKKVMGLLTERSLIEQCRKLKR